MKKLALIFFLFTLFTACNPGLPGTENVGSSESFSNGDDYEVESNSAVSSKRTSDNYDYENGWDDMETGIGPNGESYDVGYETGIGPNGESYDAGYEEGWISEDHYKIEDFYGIWYRRDPRYGFSNLHWGLFYSYVIPDYDLRFYVKDDIKHKSLNGIPEILGNTIYVYGDKGDYVDKLIYTAQIFADGKALVHDKEIYFREDASEEDVNYASRLFVLCNTNWYSGDYEYYFTEFGYAYIYSSDSPEPIEVPYELVDDYVYMKYDSGTTYLHLIPSLPLLKCNDPYQMIEGQYHKGLDYFS
jgi:hypothetical protein